MNKILVTLAAAGAISLGAVAVAEINPLGIASAAGHVVTAGGTDGSHAGKGAGQGGQILSDALDQLVADGTITRTQADAISAKVKTVAGTVRGDRKAMRQGIRQAAAADAAAAIGITPAQLKTELKAGASVADVAKAHGVAVDTVITKLVTDAGTKIDQAVTAGKLTATQATNLKAKLPDVITKLVNRTHPLAGRGTTTTTPATTVPGA